ncbi:MAG: hypothetical protein U1C04_25970 [Hydrogenophaga sp.]|uniref:hypothetical protein n=1 Tax=Hydrogenophaga sp. TaxID=1904254 RepID=UPI002ABC1F0F|nr:hypothetical protein [Hydrogenophaga sp.]MDZ4284192.1 hypothetical protein [Hydrogenophaga sp.]
MRFDYYQATIEDDPRRVVDTLAKLGHQLDPCHNLAKSYRYSEGYRIMHNDVGLVGTVMLGGNGPYAHAFASSEATDAFCSMVRNEWPERHLVTRFDPCQDFNDGKARRTLTRTMRRFAKARRMRLQVIYDPLDPTAGQTTYLGSPASEYRMRTYDKGWEQFGKLQALYRKKGMQLQADQTILNMEDGVEVKPGDWIRAELQARPKDEAARRLAATATPEQAWGFTEWSHDLAAEVFALELERIYMRTRKVSKDEEALRWMCRQYGAMLQRYKVDLGDWACVGLEVGRIIQDQIDR